VKQIKEEHIETRIVWAITKEGRSLHVLNPEAGDKEETVKDPIHFMDAIKLKVTGIHDNPTYETIFCPLIFNSNLDSDDKPYIKLICDLGVEDVDIKWKADVECIYTQCNNDIPLTTLTLEDMCA